MTDPSRTTRRLWIGAATIGALALVVLAADALLALQDDTADASVRLVPAAEAGPDPFTASVQVGPATTLAPPAVAAAASTRSSLPTDHATGTLVARGGTPGLYGGSGDRHVCDPQLLVTYLAAHPSKAAAWGSVLGVRAADIGRYVAGLTPVVLTADTVVTNHGYAHGRATSLQSVLQAGTAVLVDATGTPRVKCNCGNPLTPPAPVALSSASTHGTAWPGYAAARTVQVRGVRPLGTLTLTDVTTGRPYEQPVGTSGTGLDGTWTISVTSPGSEECGVGSIDGGTLTIAGTGATVDANGTTFHGTVVTAGDATGGGTVTITATAGAAPDAAPPEVVLTGTVGPDGTFHGSSTYAGELGNGGTGYTCEFPFIAEAGPAGPGATVPPTTAPTTTVLTTTTAPAGAITCTRRPILADPGEGDYLTVFRCEGDWAIIGTHDEATRLWQWNGDGWVGASGTGPGTPLCTGTEVPAAFRSYACTAP